jgi:transcriptional regulator with XRE-family HTH domain
MRQRSGESHEALALAAQIERSHLGAIERGESNVTALSTVKIAAVLVVSVAELMTEAR